MWILSALFIVLSIVSNASAWDEPPDFRGIKWGWTYQEIRSNLPHMVIPDVKILVGKHIHSRPLQSRIGDADTDEIYGFLDDGFAAVTITFHSRDFETIRGAFFKKYGEPQSSQKITLRNQANAAFINPVYQWKGPTLTILLEKFAGSASTGLASISKQEFIEEQQREKTDKAKDTAKGL